MRQFGLAICACVVFYFFAVGAAYSVYEYRYDDAGRLIKVYVGDGSEVTYELDAAGNRQSVTRGADSRSSLEFGGNRSVSESQNSVTFMVERVGDAGGSASVECFTEENTASESEDFSSTRSTLTWQSGDSDPKPCVVPVLNDDADEPTEGRVPGRGVRDGHRAAR